jgi:hypothetical protein
MKRIIISALFLILLPSFVQAQAPTQPKLNGYISAEYINGQEEGIYPEGTFQNPQLGLMFSGMLVGKVGYVAEVVLKQDAKVELNQALLAIGFSRTIAINLGLYLVPFGQYNETSRAHQTFLIQRPLSVDNLYPLNWRDIGVQAEGSLFGLPYSVYLANGLSDGERFDGGQQFKDNNAHKSFGGRFAWDLDGKFIVGYSYYNGKYDNDNSKNRVLHGVDASWVDRSFQILGEYTWTDIQNPDSYDKGEGKGYFILLTFDFMEVWPVVSYQKLDYQDPLRGIGYTGSDNPGEGISRKQERWSLGVVYMVSQMAFFKFEYQINKEEGLAHKNNVYLFQVALSF